MNLVAHCSRWQLLHRPLIRCLIVALAARPLWCATSPSRKCAVFDSISWGCYIIVYTASVVFNIRSWGCSFTLYKASVWCLTFLAWDVAL